MKTPTIRHAALAPLALLAVLIAPRAAAQTDLVPPTAPTGLSATAASCGQVNLSWSPSSDGAGGSGLKAYTISRNDQPVGGNVISIGAARTTFSDTNYVKSSTVMTYTVLAVDNAGNKSAASYLVSVTTPACPTSTGEISLDSASMAPLGKAIASFGSLTAVLYKKGNPVTQALDTWIALTDSSTGQTSRFLLHVAPGYAQVETDYVLTSANELWTLSHQATLGGNVLVSQYRLNGTPPTSATLLSTKALGDTKSVGKSMLLLRSGALLVAWNQEGWGTSAYDLTAGLALRTPSGQWFVQSPVTIPNSGGGSITLSQWAIAQQPGDGSIWIFVKRDSFHQLSALHLSETSGGFTIDWIRPAFIDVAADGNNGPEGEFPFLVAAPDSSRNAILLAYQRYDDRAVFMDPLYGSMNRIFLKDAPGAIAIISPDASKSFLSFPSSIERCSQFAMSVLTDGSIWLAYHPINAQSLTWNEVYARQYQGGAWTAPALAGRNYRTYDVASGGRDPGLILHRPGQAQVAFLTPDQKIHSVPLSDSAPAPDTAAPTSSITNPLPGASLSGTVAVSASASDNIGVARVDFLVDGAVRGSSSAAPYSFAWDTSTVAAGAHTLRAIAYDAAGNSGPSADVPVTVQAPPASDTTAPAVAIVSPANGSLVARNKALAISASATDSAGVARVDFYVNGALIGSDTAAPYSVSWKVPGKPGVSYVLKSVAYDQAGNSASASVSVASK